MTTVETAFLRTLPGWQPDRNGISRTFDFDDFGAGMRFVGRIADDVVVARRIQRLVGDHRHPVGRAGPLSPAGPLTGIRPRPVGQAGP